MKITLIAFLLCISSAVFAQSENCQLTFPKTVTLVEKHYPVEIVSSCWINKVEIVVYNRWGLEIYKSNNLIHDWQGKETQDGVYYITAKGEYRNGEKFEAAGFVNFIR